MYTALVDIWIQKDANALCCHVFFIIDVSACIFIHLVALGSQNLKNSNSLRIQSTWDLFWMCGRGS